MFKPEGGIEWRVMLDPQTWLPRTMVHKEGDRTITVTFKSYENFDGIKLEKEIQRSAGDPSRSSIIRFTKTVINPPIDASLFLIRTQAGGDELTFRRGAKLSGAKARFEVADREVHFTDIIFAFISDSIGLALIANRV